MEQPGDVVVGVTARRISPVDDRGDPAALGIDVPGMEVAVQEPRALDGLLPAGGHGVCDRVDERLRDEIGRDDRARSFDTTFQSRPPRVVRASQVRVTRRQEAAEAAHAGRVQALEDVSDVAEERLTSVQGLPRNLESRKARTARCASVEVDRGHNGNWDLELAHDSQHSALSRERLCDLVNTGATTLSIVLADQAPNSTRLEFDGDLLHLPGLGVSCRAQAVEAETIDRVVEVLADADRLPAQLPLIEDVAAGTSLGERTVEDDPEVLVRLLGEIDVVGGRKPLTPKQTAVVAYIALHAPVAAERIEDAIWTEPTSSRRKRMSNTVSDCRFSLGEEHLPFAHEGRYSVGPRVGTDLALFERRVAYAADRPPEEAVALLRQAMELVRGPVFTYRSLDRSSYVWIDIENWMTTWELKVATAAMRLSELALELGDTEAAIWAAERGLLALPTNSPLTEALMKAYRAAGDVEAAERV